MVFPKVALLKLVPPGLLELLEFVLQQYVINVEASTSLFLKLFPQGRSQCIVLLLAEASNEHHVQLYNNQALSAL